MSTVFLAVSSSCQAFLDNYLAAALNLNYSNFSSSCRLSIPDFPDNCFFLQLIVFKENLPLAWFYHIPHVSPYIVLKLVMPLLRKIWTALALSWSLPANPWSRQTMRWGFSSAMARISSIVS